MNSTPGSGESVCGEKRGGGTEQRHAQLGGGGGGSSHRCLSNFSANTRDISFTPSFSRGRAAHAGRLLRDPQKVNEIVFISVSREASPDLQGAAATTRAELSARERGCLQRLPPMPLFLSFRRLPYTLPFVY